MLKLEGPFGERFADVVGGQVKVKAAARLLEKLAEIDGRVGTTSQIFNASRIAGKAHLVHAANLALTARATGRNLAGSLNIEFVCWAAGLRQIDRALTRVGLQKNTKTVALLVVGATEEEVRKAREEALRELGIGRDDRVLEVGPEKIPSLAEAFSISEREQEVADIQKLVLERVALLATRR